MIIDQIQDKRNAEKARINNRDPEVFNKKQKMQKLTQKGTI